MSIKYFELLADEVWEGNTATISSVSHLGDRERNARLRPQSSTSTVSP